MVTAVVLAFLVVIGCCSCDNATDDSENAIPGSSMPAPTILDSVYKAVASCAEREAFTCLRKRAIFLLDRAATFDKLPVWGDAVVLVKSTTNFTLPDDATDRSVGESFANFLDSRRIQLRLPRLSYFSPTFEELVSGRGKKNKGYGMMAMTIAGAMMAMGMAGLAAMAGKALAASMAALMLALVAALKKSGGGHHSDHPSYEVISIPAHHQHRSFAEEQHLNSPYRYDETDNQNLHHHERR